MSRSGRKSLKRETYLLIAGLSWYWSRRYPPTLRVAMCRTVPCWVLDSPWRPNWL